MDVLLLSCVHRVVHFSVPSYTALCTALSCALHLTLHPPSQHAEPADNATAAIQLEVLSLQPRIFKVRNFASAAELAALQQGVETGVSVGDTWDTGKSRLLFLEPVVWCVSPCANAGMVLYQSIDFALIHRHHHYAYFSATKNSAVLRLETKYAPGFTESLKMRLFKILGMEPFQPMLCEHVKVSDGAGDCACGYCYGVLYAISFIF